MAKFLMKETVGKDLQAFTVRLGAGVGVANHLTSAEQGKAVKLVGESRFGLASAGDPLEATIVAVESFTQDDYSIGSVVDKGNLPVTFGGSQADGTGVLAIGDYVVVGAVVAKGTKLVAPVRVAKATVQPGATPATLLEAGAQIKAALYAWRVVSLGTAGTGAVGTTGLVERVGA